MIEMMTIGDFTKGRLTHPWGYNRTSDDAVVLHQFLDQLVDEMNRMKAEIEELRKATPASA